jgi:predicted acylesterase/phospholipase RssA
METLTNKWQPQVIVLGPGGVKGFLLLGCLKRLTQDTFLEKINHWVGVSAGAAIALLLVCGLKVDEIISICFEIDLVEDVLAINLDESGKRLGLLQNKTVETKMEKCIKNKYGYIPNLEQLFVMTGLELTMVTFNIDAMEPVYLHHNTHGQLSCVEAAMMSMAVPLLMQPRKYNGQAYIDGALGAPYPVCRFDDLDVLGLYISSEIDLYSAYKKPITFIYKLVQSGIKRLREIEIEHCSDKVKHISLKTEITDTTGIALSRDAKQAMIDSGYQCGERFLARLENPYQIELSATDEFSFEE